MYKKADLTMVLNGALPVWCRSGRTADASLGAATLIGGVGGVIVVFAVPMLDKLKIDDVVGAIPVHLIAGIWGTLAVPLTNGDASFGTQITSILIAGAFTFVVSWVVWTIINLVMGIRVTEEEEFEGSTRPSWHGVLSGVLQAGLTGRTTKSIQRGHYQDAGLFR